MANVSKMAEYIDQVVCAQSLCVLLPSSPAHVESQKASNWVWDETYERCRYYNGQEWVWQEGGEGSATGGK